LRRYGNLFQKIVTFDNFLSAAYRAFRGKKDNYAAVEFYFNYEYELLALLEELISGTYTPHPLTTFYIRDPKVRLISAPEFRDRVLHHAICNIIEPILEKGYIPHSFACRKGKGTHRAIKQTQAFCRKYDYFLKCDIKKYFESIDHKVLKKRLTEKFKDAKLAWLLNVVIESSTDRGSGIPIGSLTSQHFANFYLDGLDHYIKEELGVKGYLRYMDDFILFAPDKPGLHILKSKIATFLENQLRLELKEKATVIAPVRNGVPFLGFRVFPRLLRLKQENKRRYMNKLKTRNRQFRKGIISEEKYAKSLSGIIEHLKIANTYHLRRKIGDVYWKDLY
jgi:RNA-directed DNA polymerase